MARPNTYPKKTSFPAGAGFLGDSDAGVFFMEANPLLALTSQAALAGNVAQDFDPTRDVDHKYLAGEYVVYGGKVYVFTNDHYGAWSASDAALVPNVKKDLENTAAAVKKITGNEFVYKWYDGYYIVNNLTTCDVAALVTGAGSKCAVIDAYAGDVFYVTSGGGTSNRSYAFVKSNGDVIEKATSGVDSVNKRLVAPTNSRWLVVNDSNGTGLVVKGETIDVKLGENESTVEAVAKDVSAVAEALTITDETVNLAVDATLATGGLKGSVGETIQVSSTTAYRYFVWTGFVVGQKYVIDTRTSTSANYMNYVFGTDNSGVITELLGPAPLELGSKRYFVTPALNTTKKLYILVNVSNDAAAYSWCSVRDYKFKECATKDELQTNDIWLEALSDANLKEQATGRAFVKNISQNTERTKTVIVDELVAGSMAVTDKHKNKNGGIVRFAFITDSHKGGERTVSYDPSYNIAGFVDVANECDLAIHAGDLITNYFDPTYMPDIATVKSSITSNLSDFSGVTVPFLLAKGNHELGLSDYTAVTPSGYVANTYYVLDENTGAYYLVRSQEEYNELDVGGATFYTRSLTAMSNQDYHTLVSSSYPAGAVQGETYGAYYYLDVGSVRFVVLNDEYIIDASTIGYGTAQKTWLEGVLASALSSNLAVVTVGHKAATGNDMASSIAAFIGNGGVYVGHVHGHTHEDNYLNSAGFGDIGVNWACIKKSQNETYNAAVFSVFEIDLTAKLLREVRTGAWFGGENTYRSEDRVFDFSNQTEIV